MKTSSTICDLFKIFFLRKFYLHVLSLAVKSVTCLTCSGSCYVSVYSNLIRFPLKDISSKGIFCKILRFYSFLSLRSLGDFLPVLWLLWLGAICRRKLYLHGVTTWCTTFHTEIDFNHTLTYIHAQPEDFVTVQLGYANASHENKCSVVEIYRIAIFNSNKKLLFSPFSAGRGGGSLLRSRY